DRVAHPVDDLAARHHRAALPREPPATELGQRRREIADVRRLVLLDEPDEVPRLVVPADELRVARHRPRPAGRLDADPLAAEALHDGDDGEDADERNGHAVADEELRLLDTREVGRDARGYRIEDGGELARGEAGLPGLDRARPAECARRDVAAAHEAAVA